LELGPRRVALPEEPWAVGWDAVPVREQIDITDVVRLEDDDPGRPFRLEAAIDLGALDRWRRQRIEQDDLALRLDDPRRHVGLPVVAFAPLPVALPPEPQSRGDVADLDGHHR